MRFLFLTCCILFLSQPLSALSEGIQESAPVELSDFLSISPHPGEGSLVFSGETDQETLSFGIDSGIYGLGMVLKGAWLPEPYRKDLDNRTLIQISMGTLKSKLEGKVAEFGILTLVTPEIPKETSAFDIFDPGKSSNNKRRKEARAMFMSPRAQLLQGDPEKLQGTYFGKSGGVTLTPVGAPKQIVIRSKENKLLFKSQVMKVELNMQLSTPFNPLEKKLTGSIQFPIYIPQGKNTENLMIKLANRIEGAPVTPKLKGNPGRKITGK